MNGPEIDPNKLREDGLDYATDQLMRAALVVKGWFNLRESSIEIIKKHSALTAVIAVLAHLDERAEERRILKETGLEELRRIADSVELGMDFYDSVAIRASGIKYDKK